MVIEQSKYEQLMDSLQSMAREYVKWRIDLDMWDPQVENEDLASQICEWVGDHLPNESEYEDLWPTLSPTPHNFDPFDFIHDHFWQKVEALKSKIRNI